MFVNKTPRFYKVAADYVKKIQENTANIKHLIYSKQHPNIMGLYALVNEVIKHIDQIKYLITHAKLESITTKNPWLIYVLITELLWGKKQLPDIKSTTFVTILSNKQQLENLLPIAEKNIPVTEKTVSTPKYVRVNTLKISVSDAILAFIKEGYNYKKCKNKGNYQAFLSEASSLEEHDFMSDIHFNELLLFHPSSKFFYHNAYQNGLIILQDKASCIPAYLLNPPPGSTVLDACAAPGTKTTLLASLMKNDGTLYAVDRNQSRFQELQQFVEKSGATCVKTVHKDLMNLNGTDFPNVQYILVDPSCSGSGMLDRIGETTVENGRLKKLQGMQVLLLKHCMRRFRHVKRIVYSTCSIHPEENEEVVKDFLSSTYNFQLISAKKLLNAPWVNFGSCKYGDIGKKCLYSRPEKDLTNGFFVAVFEKLNDGKVNPYYRKLVTEPHLNDIKTFKIQKENELRPLSESKDEIGDIRKINFQPVLRKKKRSSKKIKREIVIKEETEKSSSHMVYNANILLMDTENVSNPIKNNESGNGSKNIIGSLKEKEHLGSTKKSKRGTDYDQQYRKIKKIEESNKVAQLSTDVKEDENQFESNISQHNNKVQTKRKRRKSIDINGVNDDIFPLKDKPKKPKKLKKNCVELEELNSLEVQKLSADSEWTNSPKRVLSNSATIKIDALKVSSEKEKLKSRLLKKTFTFLNQSESPDLEKCINSNSSILNDNENKNENALKKSMDNNLGENKEKIKHLEDDTIENTFAVNRKSSKNAMIPFKGIIENNIALIDRVEAKSNIEVDVKHKRTESKKTKKKHSKNNFNANIGIQNAEKGDKKNNGVNNLKTKCFRNLGHIKECNSDNGNTNMNKKYNSKDCDTSILDKIVAIINN